MVKSMYKVFCGMFVLINVLTDNNTLMEHFIFYLSFKIYNNSKLEKIKTEK